MNKISAVIITFNEEENIDRCIDSVKAVADEVIVVDSNSTDRTLEIAKQRGANTYTRSFDTYGLQKNYANSLASYDYILSLDADEALSKELIHSINQAKAHSEAEAYTMNRLNFFEGKPVRTCGLYPDRKMRLFKKDKAKWDAALVHELLVLEPMATTEHLQGDILHYTYPSKEAMVKQHEKFAAAAANELRFRPLPYLILKMILSPLAKFAQSYFFSLGFMEGSVGRTICYHQARAAFLKHFLAIKLKLFSPRYEQ